MKTNTEQLRELQQEMNARIEKIINESEKPELIKGKWYITEDGDVLLNWQGIGSNKHFGFLSGEWQTCTWTYNENVFVHEHGARPATPQEVEEVLIKEARRRGYKWLDTIVPLPNGSSKINETGFNEYNYYQLTDDFQFHGVRIYQQGQWATIIPEPKPITIGGRECEIRESMLVCEANYYTKLFWQQCKEVADYESINIVMHGQTLSIELINDIIKRLGE